MGMGLHLAWTSCVVIGYIICFLQRWWRLQKNTRVLVVFFGTLTCTIHVQSTVHVGQSIPYSMYIHVHSMFMSCCYSVLYIVSKELGSGQWFYCDNNYSDFLSYIVSSLNHFIFVYGLAVYFCTCLGRGERGEGRSLYFHV